MLKSRYEIREFLFLFKNESRKEFDFLGAVLEHVNFPIRRLKP